ncbi:hypothetical protein Dimus_030730, partial [Dionaea muscipula]
RKTIQARSVETSFVLPTTDINQPPTLLKEPTLDADKGEDPDVRLSRSILDSINKSVEERIATAYAMVDDGLYPRDHAILLGTEPRRLSGSMMVNAAETICQQAENMQEKEKEWKMLEERFKELEKKRDEREKEYQQKMIELKEASAWGQKLHRENGELQKQARNQELDRSTSQQLQENIDDLRRDLQSKVDAESRAVQELHKVQSAQKSAEQMVSQQSEPIKELRATNQSLKERLDAGKKKRKDLVGVFNEYDGRLKVNVIQEFVHSTMFEDGLAKVIGPWFKNGFSFCFAQIKDIMQKTGQNLSILKGVNMDRKIDFPTEPYVAYPDEYLPSHPSSAKLPSPFKFLKD